MLVVHDPFAVLNQLENEVNTWVGRRGKRQSPFPAVTAVPDGENVILRFDVPGVDVAKDVEVTFAPGQLTVEGTRKEELKSANSYVSEVRYGTFRRAFALPENVTPEHISASYSNGVLELTVKEVNKRPDEPVKINVEITEEDNVSKEIKSEPSEKENKEAPVVKDNAADESFNKNEKPKETKIVS